MFAIELNDKNYAVGLKWSRLAGEKVSAELAAISKEMEMHYGFTRKLEESDNQFVYQVALSDDKASSGLVSAAAVVADLVENIILVQKVTDEMYWVCCVADSEVVPGGDELIKSDLVEDKFLELKEHLDVLDSRFCVHASIAETLDDSVEVVQFEDILEENEILKPLKVFSHYKLKSLKGVPVAGALFVLFAILLGGAGYFFTQSTGPVIVDVEQIKLPEVIIKKPVEENIPPKPKEPTQEELLQKAYDEEVVWMTEEMSSQNPHEIISAIGGFTYGLPKFFSGWSSSQVLFDNKNPERITVVWTRGELGTSLSLKETVKNNIGISFSLDGSTARTTHTINDIEPRVFETDIVSSIREDKYKTAQFMHDLESLSLNWSLDLLVQDEPRKQRIAGIKDMQEAKRKQLRLGGKVFTVRGDRFNTIYTFNDIFTKSKSSIIKNITINLTENNWTVNGVLYEK